MVYRFIELGDGYSDVYELVELAKRMPERIRHFVVIDTTINELEVSSLAIVMKSAKEGNFTPVYFCREGLQNTPNKVSKRFTLFENIATANNMKINRITVKPSNFFHEKALYFQYLVGIFQMNRFL